MGILDIFKKKEDPFEALMKDTGEQPDLNIPELSESPDQPKSPGEPSFPKFDEPRDEPKVFPEKQEQSFGQPYQPNQFSGQRDIELILSKLDAVRAILTSLDQRVANLERIASGEDQNQPRW